MRRGRKWRGGERVNVGRGETRDEVGVGGKKGEVSKEERRKVKWEKMGETGKRKVIVNGRGREWLNRINDKWEK